jgi:hypothetical protein
VFEECNERHRRAGIMTRLPDGYDATRPYVATIVCERPACQDRARFWPQGTAGETALYRPEAPMESR